MMFLTCTPDAECSQQKVRQKLKAKFKFSLQLPATTKHLTPNCGSLSVYVAMFSSECDQLLTTPQLNKVHQFNHRISRKAIIATLNTRVYKT